MLDYTAIDFETANAHRGSPCAVGLVRVRKGTPVDEQRWMIRPPASVDYFDSFNTSIHGITSGAVSDAPRWREILPRLVDYVGEDIAVAHNAAFDIGVIRSACAIDGIGWPEMKFLCTLVLSRRALPLASYRLPFVTSALGIEMSCHHDPLTDARAVAGVVRALSERHQAVDVQSLARALGVTMGRMEAGMYQASRANGRDLVRPDISPDADPDGYLYGAVVVFSGALSTMTRQTAWERCAKAGATPEDGVTKRTTVLVWGDVNPANFRPGVTLSTKVAKAFALRDRGRSIEVMSEDDFLRCLGGEASAGGDVEERRFSSLDDSATRSTSSFEIDVKDYISEGLVREWAEKRAQFFASLSPEERTEEEARVAEDERLRFEDERFYEELVVKAQRAVRAQHRQIVKDRKAGVVGTLTEIGRPYHMSAIEVGKILKRHGLREVVDAGGDADPVAEAMRQYEEGKRQRWAEFNARFHRDGAQETPRTEDAQSSRRSIQGIIDGFAVWDPIDGREFWIVAKVAPLLEAEACPA